MWEKLQRDVAALQDHPPVIFPTGFKTKPCVKRGSHLKVARGQIWCGVIHRRSFKDDYVAHLQIPQLRRKWPSPTEPHSWHPLPLAPARQMKRPTSVTAIGKQRQARRLCRRHRCLGSGVALLPGAGAELGAQGRSSLERSCFLPSRNVESVRPVYACAIWPVSGSYPPPSASIRIVASATPGLAALPVIASNTSLSFA